MCVCVFVLIVTLPGSLMHALSNCIFHEFTINNDWIRNRCKFGCIFGAKQAKNYIILDFGTLNMERLIFETNGKKF